MVNIFKLKNYIKFKIKKRISSHMQSAYYEASISYI